MPAVTSDTTFHDLPEVRALLRMQQARITSEASLRPHGHALVLRARADARANPVDTRHLLPVRQHVEGGGLSGDASCHPQALCWHDAAFQLVVVQHAGEALGACDGLLPELARVLAPGGILLWFGLNPCSPWLARLRWTRPSGTVRAPQAVTAGAVRRRLLAEHLSAMRVEWLGPWWRDGGPADAGHRPAPGPLRAAYLLRAVRQQSAAIPLRVSPSRAAAASAGPLAVPSRRACA